MSPEAATAAIPRSPPICAISALPPTSSRAAAATAAAAEGEITVESIERHLDSAELPPLDLLIRTSGELRLSNFLLWQLAYSELHFTGTFWPDFTPEALDEAIASFQKRERRFGQTGDQVAKKTN